MIPKEPVSKICTRCNESKPLSKFGAQKSRKDGLRSACRECNNAAAAGYVLANREKVSASNAAQYKANPEKKKAASAAWYSKNKERASVYGKENIARSRAAQTARRKANPEKTRIANAEWRKANPKKAKDAVSAWKKTHQSSGRAATKRWRDANPEKSKARSAAWTKQNPDRRRATCQNYRAQKSKATPSWDLELTNFSCLEAAALCVRREALGLGYWHIDHQIPINGQEVCGLHVWSNLAVVPAKFNLEKGNRISELYKERAWL